MSQRHERQLNHFHMTWLCRKLGIRWQDKGSDIEILSRTCLSSVHILLMRAQTQWADHVTCMQDEHISEQLLFSEHSTGRCLHRGQKTHFKDTLKVSLRSLNIDTRNSGTKLPYMEWPHSQGYGWTYEAYEARCIAKAQCKHKLRKTRA